MMNEESFHSLDHHHHAGSQAFVVLAAQVIEVDAYGDALLYLHEVAGRVVRRYERVFGAGGARDGCDASREFPVLDGVYADAYLLADGKILDLCFLVVGHNPFLCVG